MYQRKKEQDDAIKLWVQEAIDERSAAKAHKFVADDKKLPLPGRERVINGASTMEPSQIMEARAEFWGTTMWLEGDMEVEAQNHGLWEQWKVGKASFHNHIESCRLSCRKTADRYLCEENDKGNQALSGHHGYRSR